MKIRFLLSLALAACGGPAQQSALPAGWSVLPRPARESAELRCANWSGKVWDVVFNADTSRVQFPPFARRELTDTLQLSDGRLVANDMGEFGAEVRWEPTVGVPSLISNRNLHMFVQMGGRIYGLAGIAHMGVNRGELEEFGRVNGTWRVDSVANLGAAPRAYARLSKDTLLVVTYDGVVRVSPPRNAAIIYRNMSWHMTSPFAIAQDRSGTIYVGMLGGVARLTPVGGRFREDWLVPTACAHPQETGRAGDCACHA